MDIEPPIHPKVIIPYRKRKQEVDPLNIDINLGVPTSFISKKNKNTYSLLERAKKTLEEAREIEEEENKKENISKLLNNLDLIINNKEEEEKEKEEKEEKKDNNPLEKEILDLKERINKVSNKLDSFNPSPIKSNIISNNKDIITNKKATWVEVAKKNITKKETTPINKEKSTSYKNQRLVLITKDKEQKLDSYNLKNKINKNLKEKLKINNNIIISITKNRNSNIIITIKEGYTPNILLENKETWQNSFIFNKAIKDRDYYNLIIHDIPNKVYNGPLALNKIKKELEEDNLGLSILGNPSWISKKENRASKATSSIIISLNTEEEREKYLGKKIFLGGSKPRIEKYYNSSPLDQCSRCLGYGHASLVCRKEEKCAYCAKNHPTKEICRNLVPNKCANCSRDHPSTSRDCPIRLALGKNKY